ncbi:MAG: hypothetical protein WA776_20590 [Xanthobacteraceae bacterium]
MNEFCRCTSPRIQPAEFKHVFENGAMSKSPPRNKKESTMLKKLAAALVATALIAGPAFAQSNSTATPSAPAAQTAPAASTASAPAAKPVAKATKAAKHTATHVRKHVSRTKSHAKHHARHAKSSKAHQTGAAKSDKQP